MGNFLKPSFWFDAYPLPFHQNSFWIITGVFLAGVVFAIICLSFKKKFKDNKPAFKVWSKLINFGFSFGPVGLILVFLKQQQTPYLGMRVWLILWLLICIVWLVFILKFVLFTVPKQKAEKRKLDELRKYIP